MFKRLLVVVALLACTPGLPRGETLPHPDHASKQVEYFVAKPEGVGPWPTIILLHGHQPDPRPGAKGTEEALQRFAKRGVVAVAVSMPGYGDSSGPPDFCGPFSQHAVSAVIAKLRSEGAIAPGKLVLQGASRGAMVAGLVAAHDTTVAGLILVAGEYDLAALAADSTATGIKAGMRHNLIAETGGSAAAVRERSVLGVAKDIRATTLILHGAADDRTDPRNAQKLANEINRAGGSARVVIYPGMGHSIPLEKRREETEPFLAKLWGDQFKTSSEEKR
ncbi:MAG TPA: alpha/beta fold hydrolase [Candidatus Krumholzibacteria bacterium]